MVRPSLTVATLLAASLWLLCGAGGSALAKQTGKQAGRARAALLRPESPGLSQDQRKYLQAEITENGSTMRSTKRTGRLTYLVGPKGVNAGGSQVSFHDKRDFVMFFWTSNLELDRKRECLVRKYQTSQTPKCLQESEGRTVVYDEVWEDTSTSGAWGRVYWKAGAFVLAVAFDDNDLSMVFERDWCVVAGRCAL